MSGVAAREGKRTEGGILHERPATPGGPWLGSHPPQRVGFREGILLRRVVASRELVVQGCEQAAQAGVTPGMTVAQARALLGRRPVRVLPSDPAGDRAGLHALATWALRYVPAVMPDAGDDPACWAWSGLLADITGCQRLYHGEINLLRQLHDAVRKLGFAARVAAAPTIGCAWAVARFGARDLAMVHNGDVREALIDLPVRALRIEPEVAAALEEIGVMRIGQLLDLPRRSLPTRFGRMLTLRLDQALGQAMETIESVRPRPPLSVTQEFAGPVKDVQVIELATRQLLEDLCHRLLGRESGLRQMEVTLKRSDCAPYRIDLSVSRFTRDAKHLGVLLRPKLERAHLGYGVEAITLTASRAGWIPHHQHDDPALGGGDAQMNLAQEQAQLVDILVNRLGPAAVQRALPVASHLPERAVRHVSVMEPPTKRWEGTRDLDPHHRPSALLPEPRPLEVMAVTPDGPLVQMQWDGQTLRVLTTIGPERLTPEWWRHKAVGWAESLRPATRAGRDGGPSKLGPPYQPCTRDYFKVQDEQGRWWWVYRELETRRWFVHGGWV